jgi:hypothetical protein
VTSARSIADVYVAATVLAVPDGRRITCTLATIVPLVAITDTYKVLRLTTLVSFVKDIPRFIIAPL